MDRFVSVAVRVPLLPALTYRVPKGLPLPVFGARVRVPLGVRIVTGCVVGDGVEVKEGDSQGAVKDLIECLDTKAFLPQEVVNLALWVAEYYACGQGDALGAAMPPWAWTLGATDGQRRTGFRTTRVAFLTTQGKEIARGKDEVSLGPRQREAIWMLAGERKGVAIKVLAERGVMGETLRRLSRRGFVRFEDHRIERDPFGKAHAGIEEKGAAFELTLEQGTALARLSMLAASEQFRVALLHGVTGSGKTEVYLRLAEVVQARGCGVLVLVPEISLTPAVAGVFNAAFVGRVAIQHSGLSDGERHDQWHRIRDGEVDVVVGTRSAVFAPLDKIGLVVVDEEHDASYKQEEAPRYHGRDVAIMRAKQANALVVLGSATPSMESYHNATSGRYTLFAIDRRVRERPLASVQVVDMRKEMVSRGADVVLSRALREALELRLDRREQALILLNRRGYASAVLCRQCNQSLECPNCSVTLTLHRAAGRVRCHYCGYSLPQPKTCPQCAGPFLERIGFGTERIEREIEKAFPGARVARFDRDAVRRRGVGQLLLKRFASREIDVMVGTQMIAKGHDFPAVTLVGVISADVGLGLADFRASERTFQLLTQVAGRAGRGDLPGQAIIQTCYPQHYSVELACGQAYVPFFEAEMRFRRSMRYPPVVAMVNAVVRGRSFKTAMREAAALANILRATPGAFCVLGPAPAPHTRLRGEHRVQIFLKGTGRREMREALQAALVARPTRRRHVTVDVDPLTVL